MYQLQYENRGKQSVGKREFGLIEGCSLLDFYLHRFTRRGTLATYGQQPNSVEAYRDGRLIFRASLVKVEKSELN